MAILTGVFDEAPANQPLPYMTIGEKVKVSWPFFQNSGWEVSIMLDIWTALDDGDTGSLILAIVDRLLHNKKLPMVHFDNALTEDEWSTTMFEEVNNVRHIPVRFRTLNSLLV